MMIEASEKLVEENFALRQELQALKIEQQVTWSMLVDVVRKLQASSASIKAAVSSLLSYDIFWDVANQHEFLLTIDASANQTSDLVMLLSLAFRLEADRLEIKREPHSLQEILTNVDLNLHRRFSDREIILSMPQEGQVVWVDYDYLSLALVLLLEVLLSNQSQMQLALVAREEEAAWKLDIVGMDASISQFLQAYRRSIDDQFFTKREDRLPPESILKLMVVMKLLDLQKMTVELPTSPDSNNPLAIHIPTRNP
jgi:K+-sensing histidine kinase KdpD